MELSKRTELSKFILDEPTVIMTKQNEQYGWYDYINRCKADFGGIHIPLDESKNSAIEFIQNLKNHLAT